MTADTSRPTAPYAERRRSHSHFLGIRHLRYHVRTWGSPDMVTPERPARVMAHGWMDLSASYQFIVDAFAEDHFVIAPDWRGFGLTVTQGVDTYWFLDYLGDLDALLDAMSPHQPVDLIGHSMGGNVSMLYAGARPARVRRLVNLEGVGMPGHPSDQAPARYGQWLDGLRQGQRLRPYKHLQEVEARLRENNPRLSPERAAWLAPHWAGLGRDGLYHLRSDPQHKGMNPVLTRLDDAHACWQAITAPVLMVTGHDTEVTKVWQGRYTMADIEARLKHVPNLQRVDVADCGHMLHHDQPEVVAAHIDAFLR